MNDSDRDVSILGNVVWSEDPPGERFVQYAALPTVSPPGATQLSFENVIPPEIVEFVEAKGPTRFAISGVVNVLEPGGVQEAFLTPTFWIVP